ncbi:MAG: CehA/McbA family metallohydrolase domain-containing protein [Armatimonadota bacterium]
MMSTFRTLVVCCLCVLAVAAFAAGKPAILICSPSGPAYGNADLTYLGELMQQGFEVDYTNNLQEVTWARIKQYNLLIIYLTPDAYDVCYRNQPSSPEKVQAFVSLIDQYLEAGGGVFLFAPENNMGKQAVAELTERWGAKFPVEHIVETDKAKQAILTHSSQQTPVAYTDNIFTSPVSEGVHGIWYPSQPAYNGGMTGPILVDGTWQVVVRASKTSKTEPVDLSKSATAVKNPFMRAQSESAPSLFAIRSVKTGRVALISQWQQFSLGAGTKWIYNREVLDRGVKDKPSDFGRLLLNTYRWLAEPSLQHGGVGGYVTPADKLTPPNSRDEVKKQYAERTWPYDPKKLTEAQPPKHLKLYRGIIGIKSTYSNGKGTVEDYAKAAREAGLDFLVFMDDFDKMTSATFDQLKADCKQYSSDKLLLMAGFNITSNIGNHLFFYGPDPAWPPYLVLTGPGKSLFYQQEVNDKGGFTGMLTPFLDWILQAYHVERGQVGYYNFTDSPNGMRLHDCRLYAAAAVQYYKNGRLVEDITDEYLTTAQCTIPPAPVAVNEITSPAELLREVKRGCALTYGQAESLDRTAPRGLFMNALRWTHQYDGLNVFFSQGPLIQSWPNCHRVWGYGGEDFARGNAVMPSPISITSEKGLREIRIYNGEKLFRRFILNGEKEFNQVLVLDGSVQKNLVLIAEDLLGGKAVSFARRCWTDGILSPSFCSDHVNDGSFMFLAHGPYDLPFNILPALPLSIAGDTWDGGPPATMPLTNYQSTSPVLISDKGKEEGYRLDPIPILEFSDQGAVAVTTLRKEAFDDRLASVVNPWHTYGPISGPSKLFDGLTRYRQFVTPTVGVPDIGWAAQGVRVGISPSLLTNVVRFKQDMTITTLLMGSVRRNENAILVVGLADGVKTVDLGAPGYPEFTVKHGEWFGYYGKGLSNAQLFFNRGETIKVQVGGAMYYWAEMKGKAVKTGETYTFELAGFGFPVDLPVTGPADFQRYVDYLKQPEGLKMTRGTRQESAGIIDLKPADDAVEFTIPKPAQKLSLTLPVRVLGLNTRWSAGLFQKQGYTKGFYGPGENRYRALGLDFYGNGYIPVFVDYAETTSMVAGHPIVAGLEGKELFIQVTNVSGPPDRWHVSVNNPTDRVITATLKKAMDLPGLDFPEKKITLKPGEYVVLQ